MGVTTSDIFVTKLIIKNRGSRHQVMQHKGLTAKVYDSPVVVLDDDSSSHNVTQICIHVHNVIIN